MACIVKKGNIPATPHSEFYAIPNVLALEEIHGSYGFNGPYTRKLHIRSYPTEQSKLPKLADFSLSSKVASDKVLQPYHILTQNIPFEKDFVRSRKPLLMGAKTGVSVSKPKLSMNENEFFKNGERHEILYVQDGSGVLKTEYGELNIRKGLYLIIPKGTIYRVDLTSPEAYFLIIESQFPITFPPHYMNKDGQATLMAPVVETEIEIPRFVEPIDKSGEYLLYIKHN